MNSSSLPARNEQLGSLDREQVRADLLAAALVADSGATLLAVVKERVAAGDPQPVLEKDLSDLRPLVGSKELEDAVLDVMDRVVGCCSPPARLYPSNGSSWTCGDDQQSISDLPALHKYYYASMWSSHLASNPSLVRLTTLNVRGVPSVAMLEVRDHAPDGIVLERLATSFERYGARGNLVDGVFTVELQQPLTRLSAGGQIVQWISTLASLGEQSSVSILN